MIQRDSARNSSKLESALFGSISQESLDSANGNGLSGRIPRRSQVQILSPLPPQTRSRKGPGLLLSLMRQGSCRTGLKDKKSWSEPDLSALRCEKVWFKVVGGQL